MNAAGKLALTAVVSGMVGAWAAIWVSGYRDGPTTGEPLSEEPIYWVAPMDPSYRRDQPGKSPMGMDLVPVYADAAGIEPQGTVTISPRVVNNLGVRTAKVMPGRLETRVETVGYVQYDEDRLIHVHPRVSGWIEALYVKAAGDPVQQGEPLYTLYSPTLVNAQEEFLLATTRRDPALIEAAAERLAALLVPSRSIDRLRQTGKVSRTITMYAERDGIVDNLKAREGMYVEPGLEIMSIGTLEQVWVIAEVFERQAALVQVGDPVFMQLDYLPGREWRGQVDYVYPSLNRKTRTARVRVRLPNPDASLRPGMFAQIAIATRPGDEHVLVPREALIRTANQNRVVLALGEGRFKSVAVRVGRIAHDRAEILSGLAEGDRIVTSAQFLIDSESSLTADLRRIEGDSGDHLTTGAGAGDHAHTADPGDTERGGGDSEHRHGELPPDAQPHHHPALDGDGNPEAGQEPSVPESGHRHNNADLGGKTHARQDNGQ